MSSTCTDRESSLITTGPSMLNGILLLLGHRRIRRISYLPRVQKVRMRKLNGVSRRTARFTGKHNNLLSNSRHTVA